MNKVANIPPSGDNHVPLSQSSNYVKLLIRNVSSSEEELVSFLCFENGASGVSENLKFRQNLEDYSIQTVESDLKELEVFFEDKPASDLESILKEKFPRLEFRWQTEENKDWLEEWKKGFVPFELVNGVWVVPHWCPIPGQAKEIIWMEPGMAFGTGTHETTQIAALLMNEAIGELHPRSAIDVGTGTGLLAILGQKLGLESWVGTDIDPEAIRVAKENLDLNKITNIQITQQDLGEFNEGFDLVVANIIDGVLTTLQAPLRRLVKPGGSLILSGIIDERKEHFENRFRREPLQLKKQIQKNEWHGYWLVRPK